jgi:hypothetical protein
MTPGNECLRLRRCGRGRFGASNCAHGEVWQLPSDFEWSILLTSAEQENARSCNPRATAIRQSNLSAVECQANRAQHHDRVQDWQAKRDGQYPGSNGFDPSWVAGLSRSR